MRRHILLLAAAAGVMLAVPAPAFADSAAIGADLSGAAGDLRTLRFGVRNDGNTAETPQPVKLTLPPGVEAVQADENCDPVGPRVFSCDAPKRLPAAAHRIYSFDVRLGEYAGRPGTVAVDSGEDTAPIRVTLTAGAQKRPEAGGSVGTLAGLGAAGVLIGAGAFWRRARFWRRPTS